MVGWSLRVGSLGVEEHSEGWADGSGGKVLVEASNDDSISSVSSADSAPDSLLI